MQRHPTFIPVTPSLPSPPGSPLSPFENDEKKKCNELRANMNFNRHQKLCLLKAGICDCVSWTEVLYCPSFTYASNSQRLEELKTPPLILEFLFCQWSHDRQYFPEKNYKVKRF